MDLRKWRKKLQKKLERCVLSVVILWLLSKVDMESLLRVLIIQHANTLKNQKRIIDRLEKTDRQNTVDPDHSYIDTDEFRKILDTAIEQLPDKCKAIFLLSKQQELSNKEIAERLGISVKTVENQMTIALKKLREYLLPYRGKIFIIFLVHFLS